MAIKVDKQSLIEKLKQTEDEVILKQIEDILNQGEKDFWDELSEAEKADIAEGLAQLDRGEGIPHDKVIKEIKDRFLKRK